MAGLLEIEGVHTAYDKADVLEGVSLKIEPGRITCLLGSNGSGKTTLIRSILGLTRPPKLLLIDEPSLGLSPLFVKENFNIIRKINERGISIFLVEQNVHQTLAISDYGYVLSKGRVVMEGTPGEIGKTKEVQQAYFG